MVWTVHGSVWKWGTLNFDCLSYFFLIRNGRIVILDWPTWRNGTMDVRMSLFSITNSWYKWHQVTPGLVGDCGREAATAAGAANRLGLPGKCWCIVHETHETCLEALFVSFETLNILKSFHIEIQFAGMWSQKRELSTFGSEALVTLFQLFEETTQIAFFLDFLPFFLRNHESLANSFDMFWLLTSSDCVYIVDCCFHKYMYKYIYIYAWIDPAVRVEVATALDSKTLEYSRKEDWRRRRTICHASLLSWNSSLESWQQHETSVLTSSKDFCQRTRFVSRL